MGKIEIPITPFYLIPQWQSEKLESSNANFSLSFSKMNLWKERKKNNSFEIFNKLDSWEEKEVVEGKTVKVKYVEVAEPKAIFNNEHLCKLCNQQLKDKQIFLDKINYNQREYIDFMNGSEINAKLVSPLITGLGSGHPTETGMILDRNTGVPYIPASSIKGVLRTAYAVSIADENGNADDKKLYEIFGSENNSSKVIFLDAYPEEIPTIQSDIMNPHFSKYYGGENKIPLENENPVPIKFLSVKEGCDFVFRYIVKDENLKSEIESAFKIAFETIGFGGKTAIGYGRFKSELKIEEVVPKQEKKDYSEADIDELVRKIKPEQVKMSKSKQVKAIISSGKPIKAKIFVKYENLKDAQIFEITVSGMANAEIGKEINVTLNNFNKKAPLGGRIS